MTTVEQEMREFLARPENLPTATEVARHVAKMRVDAHKAFWSVLENALQHRLKGSAHAAKWFVHESDATYKNAWFKLSIMPKLALDHQRLTLLAVTFEQNSLGKGYRLYYGLRWTHNTNHKMDLAEYQALRLHLLDRGHKLVESVWWVMTKGTGYAARGDNFLFRMAQEKETFIREMVDMCWDLFLDTADLVNAFNEAVVKTDVM